MRARDLVRALFALGLTTTVPGVAPGQATERRVLAGREVAIYNLVGSIRLESGTGSDVAVEVTRRGSDGARLEIATGDLRGRASLRVIYPERRIVYREEGASRWSYRTELRVDSDGTFGDGGDGWRSDGDRYQISSSGSGFEGWADVRVIVPRGKNVAIYLGVGEAAARGVEGDISMDVSAARVTTTDTRGTLNLDTGSGEVSITNADGEVNLDSGSGGVTLTRVRGPHLTIDSGSGSIRASGIESADLSLDTGSGEVRLSGVRARSIDLDTGSGSVDVQLLDDVESMRVDAGSGGVTIGVPESLGAEVEIETGSGGIDADVPITVRRKGRNSLTGSIGDGRGRITIDAGSGGVRLRRS